MRAGREMPSEAGGKRIIFFGAVDKTNYYGKAVFIPSPVWLVMEKTCNGSRFNSAVAGEKDEDRTFRR